MRGNLHIPEVTVAVSAAATVAAAAYRQSKPDTLAFPGFTHIFGLSGAATAVARVAIQ